MPPTVLFEGKDLTNIQADGATVAGEVKVLGSSPITQHGHVWSETKGVDLDKAGDSKTELGELKAVGTFNSNLTGLAAGKTYYVKAYATNAEGTGYSEELTFNTSQISPALTFVSADITAIGQMTATASANLTVLGSAPIIQRGHIWSLTPNPSLTTASVGKTELGTASATGKFSSDLKSLTQGSTYYVRAYVYTATDTVYSSQLTLATLGDVNLSATSIAENSVGGSTIGTLSTAGGDGFSYSLASGAGADNNAAFQIDGSTLKTASATTLDFETKTSYKIRVQSAKGGQTFARAFVITVTNVNEQPTALALTKTSIAENTSTGTQIGTFSTTDPDAGDSHTYELAAGGADNGSFQISGNVLQTKAALDYETDSVYNIKVSTKDAGNETLTKDFVIKVTNVNEQPTALSLSGLTIAENSATGTQVGTFSTTDVDAGDSHTYELVSGGADNASFEIDGNALKTKAVFDYEADSVYNIKVSSKDAGNLTVAQDFTIKVTDVTVKATNILLSTDSIFEGNALGDSVGLLSSTPAPESKRTYTLVAGFGDNSSFTISSDTLKANAVFDFETKTSYSIKVKTANAAGSFEKTLTIKIRDNKPPPAPALTSPANSASNVALNTKLVWGASPDPEGDAVSYTVLLGTASTPKDTVSESQVGTEYTPTGQKSATTYYWQIIASDANGQISVSSVRSYTTDNPPVLSNFAPATNAVIDSTRTPTLSWTGTDADGDAITYDVYLDTLSTPVNKVASGQAGTMFKTPRLKFKRDYYWKVEATDAKGNKTTSSTFKLTSPDRGAVWVDAGASAHWSARSAHTSVVFNNKIWVIGGAATDRTNDVWSSADGVSWTEVENAASWPSRFNHTAMVYDNKIWVMGGDGLSGRLNDVWSSTDGITWTNANATGHWTARKSHKSIVYNNRMWVIGGNTSTGTSAEVWYSTNGTNWTNANATGHWGATAGFACTATDSKIWVMGGEKDLNIIDDVWSSTDGSSWTKESPTGYWSPRNESVGVYADGKIWLIGGDGSAGSRDEVWYSTDGTNWTQSTGEANFGNNLFFATVLFDDKIWMLGGLNRITATKSNKVWYTDLAE